jgi:signal peptidase II
MNTRDLGFAVAGAALVIDQATKLLLLYGFGFAHMAPGEAVEVLPFFNLVMVKNYGFSYGLFPASGPEGTAILASLQMLAIALLGWWLWVSQHRLLGLGLGLVIGGALGNLVDRLIYGWVADFFHFYALGYDWYVFNMADVAITAGVAVLMYDALLRPERVASPRSRQ